MALGGNDNEKNWNSDRMIDKAKGLLRVAHELDGNKNSPKSDPLLFSGEFIAIPVLLALAMEIVLKAWQCLERNGKPDKSHDLLKLFDGLEDKTQARLEARMPDVLDPYFGSKSPPVMPGLRKTLSYHNDAFERWRYSYEVRSAYFETPRFKEALAAVIEVYEEVSQKPPQITVNLGNRT